MAAMLAFAGCSRESAEVSACAGEGMDQLRCKAGEIADPEAKQAFEALLEGYPADEAG